MYDYSGYQLIEESSSKTWSYNPAYDQTLINNGTDEFFNPLPFIGQVGLGLLFFFVLYDTTFGNRNVISFFAEKVSKVFAKSSSSFFNKPEDSEGIRNNLETLSQNKNEFSDLIRNQVLEVLKQKMSFINQNKTAVEDALLNFSNLAEVKRIFPWESTYLLESFEYLNLVEKANLLKSLLEHTVKSISIELKFSSFF